LVTPRSMALTGSRVELARTVLVMQSRVVSLQGQKQIASILKLDIGQTVSTVKYQLVLLMREKKAPRLLDAENSYRRCGAVGSTR